MWVERVTARAFGGLRDQRLDLAPGLNVIHGPNEAGKSTWHAAIRMALTGVRRGRGASTREASALEDRHRPWDDRDRWAVEALVHVGDRRIDIVQDLLGKVACRATDVDLGIDVSAGDHPARRHAGRVHLAGPGSGGVRDHAVGGPGRDAGRGRQRGRAPGAHAAGGGRARNRCDRGRRHRAPARAPQAGGRGRHHGGQGPAAHGDARASPLEKRSWRMPVADMPSTWPARPMRMRRRARWPSPSGG